MFELIFHNDQIIEIIIIKRKEKITLYFNFNLNIYLSGN
jgi:hypothetical protein